ncbi:MAG: hypothetical protein IJB48_05950 [Clostridia bacterium]|nr:hypothetical protein [Clostridia bacterium]MBQ3554477.1 hypothetical protein [Clostridia bacterium]
MTAKRVRGICIFLIAFVLIAALSWYLVKSKGENRHSKAVMVMMTKQYKGECYEE